MAVNVTAYRTIKEELDASSVLLVAVSKTKPIEDILALYELGHRDFGENYVQELVQKQSQLPSDIRWHFIGHLQSNKVKYIAPFVHLIHGIDSEKLLNAVNKEGKKLNRTIDCLLQVHIAQEETKFGLDAGEVTALVDRYYTNTDYSGVKLKGLMGMASFTEDTAVVAEEMSRLKKLYDSIRMNHPNDDFSILSMGMSGDYQMAMEKGSTLVRIGSLLFGSR